MLGHENWGGSTWLITILWFAPLTIPMTILTARIFRIMRPRGNMGIGSCENSERAAMIRGMPPCSYTMRRDRQSTRSRFEQSRLASPIFLGLANDKRIYELCNPQRFGNRARNVNIVTRQVGAP